MRTTCITLLQAAAAMALAWNLGAAEIRTYTGCCDASAAAPINEELFAAASDEENTLRIYARNGEGAPLRTLSTAAFLGVGPNNEADLEGAARVGDLIFWIGSHSRNSDGKSRPSRHLLFATAIRGSGTDATLEPFGQPFRGLIAAMSADRALADLELEKASLRAAEDPGGLNIEGIAAGPDDSLWIGFRNPVPGGKAILVPLLNPRAVMERTEAPRFGPVRSLNLDGRGIRDIARDGDRYLIVAGPAEGGGRHRLYVWDGTDADPREMAGLVPKGFQAEAIVSANGVTDLLSDDGSERIGGTRCEKVRNPAERLFRVLRVKV